MKKLFAAKKGLCRNSLNLLWLTFIFQLATYVNPEKLFPKRKGIQAWIIGVAVSAGLLLLLLLIILLWWVSITPIYLRYTYLDYRGSCLSGTTFTTFTNHVSITLICLRCSSLCRTTFTFSTDHSFMVGKRHTDMSKV